LKVTTVSTHNLVRPLFAALLLGVCALAQAGFSIVGTRVVYDEAQGETNVRVRHLTGDVPVMMQAWLDDGDPQTQPGAQSVPFIMSPAVARMDPGAEQVIRIIRIGELPTDRESLFFFNVLEVPPDVDDAIAEGANLVQFNMQARLKFFYRPKGLKPAPDRAVDALRFSLEPAQADGALRLRVQNPTPYHFTLSQVFLHASAAPDAPALAELDAEREYGPMVAPHSALSVFLKPAASGAARSSAQVRYTYINDQGGYVTKQGKLD